MTEPTGPALYDPLVVDAILSRYPMPDASRADHAAAVQIMQARGVSIEETALRLGMVIRRVQRLRIAKVAPYPDMVAEYDIRERRCQHLERMADGAMSAAVDMRTDPYLAYMALNNMSRQELIETAMVLAAMVDVDRTVKDSLGWVESGLAQVIPIRKEA